MSKLTRKVKLPKEESNDNENKGRDNKDESSSKIETIKKITEALPSIPARSKSDAT